MEGCEGCEGWKKTTDGKRRRDTGKALLQGEKTKGHLRVNVTDQSVVLTFFRLVVCVLILVLVSV